MSVTLVDRSGDLDEIVDYAYPLAPLALGLAPCARCKRPPAVTGDAAGVRRVCGCGAAELGYARAVADALEVPPYAVVPVLAAVGPARAGGPPAAAFYAPGRGVSLAAPELGPRALQALGDALARRCGPGCLVPALVSDARGCALLRRHADPRRAVLVEGEPALFGRRAARDWAVAQVLLGDV